MNVLTILKSIKDPLICSKLFLEVNMNIAIVDDEIMWRQNVKNVINTYLEKNVHIVFFNSGESFLAKGQEFDIVFMDIEMEGKDGFAVIEEYRQDYPKSINIILTAHTEMSREGYKVDAFRYIDKANLKEEVEEALFSAQKLLNKNVDITLTLKTLGTVKVALKSILYFETNKRNLKVHLENEEYICKNSINELAEQLADKGFYLTHRSYLVNMQWVKEFTQNEICIKNGDKVMLSVRKHNKFKIEYIKWKFGIANK